MLGFGVSMKVNDLPRTIRNMLVELLLNADYSLRNTYSQVYFQ